MQLRLEDLAAHLKGIQESQGEEAYQTALKGFAKQLLANGDKTSEFLSKLLITLGAELDLGALQGEVEELKQRREEAQQQAQTLGGGVDMNQAMIDAIKREIPNLKTQAQFDLVMRSFEVLQHYMNAAFGQDKKLATTLREGLNQALDLASGLGEVAEKLEDNPEVTTNQDYVQPPKEFKEKGECQRLMGELADIPNLDDLQEWYADNKPTMDGIVSTALRNELFDAIRTKKKELMN